MKPTNYFEEIERRMEALNYSIIGIYRAITGCTDLAVKHMPPNGRELDEHTLCIKESNSHTVGRIEYKVTEGLIMELVPYIEDTVGLPYNLQNVANILEMTNRWISYIKEVEMAENIKVTATVLPILINSAQVINLELNDGENSYEVILFTVGDRITKIIL